YCMDVCPDPGWLRRNYATLAAFQASVDRTRKEAGLGIRDIANINNVEVPAYTRTPEAVALIEGVPLDQLTEAQKAKRAWIMERGALPTPSLGTASTPSYEFFARRLSEVGDS